ncbi:hypothetical protein KFK09_010681 [Dendrobium nobile]|uniref:Chromo domain-containing protein n=1 Tax=Dendrobium nobile TaxID=94219 RepID=A0A8T3BDF2_DENNO|nr:hypothetical protein KFK09_010681 [Dendrobium nobile]
MQNTLARRLSVKLAPRYYGPYEVEHKIGNVAYRMKLPPTTTIHPVFHVSQLKKFKGDYVPVDTLPPTLSEDGTSLLEPSALKGVRHTEEGGKEVLIEWKDLPTHDATWETYEIIQAQFPAFNLEDKVNLWAGSDNGPVRSIAAPAQKRVGSHLLQAENPPAWADCRRGTRSRGFGESFSSRIESIVSVKTCKSFDIQTQNLSPPRPKMPLRQIAETLDDIEPKVATGSTSGM